ncbi:MAG: hypothetical protein K2N63_11095 [Lachnospiraceae bacterium]|nr:hypothetical protein [Lachnospiraceae bacterium]
MKIKKITALCLTLGITISSFGFLPLSAKETPPKATQTAGEAIPYQINETTSIKNDFYHLGITREQYQNLNDILRSELISMLYLDATLYLYMAMPEETDYQVNYIIINGHKYEINMHPLDTDHNYRKYAFSGFEQAADSCYTISEIGFQNPEGREIRYDREINCKMGTGDGKYFFEQESVNHIVLTGMLLESIYQFENERGLIRDAWNNLWNNTDVKDGDQRSFYYFAFNCFDREIDHYFTPDEITEIVIDYTINQYTFKGAQEDYKTANLTRTEKKIQIVTPETIHVTAHRDYNSNGSPYIYNTIYKLSEAEIKENQNGDGKQNEMSNYNTLFSAQQAGYDWVVHFGDTQGYRYCESYTNSLFSDSCEIDYTLVEDFSAVSMKYKYHGKPISVKTDTLVDMEVLAQREKDRTESLFKQTKDTISFTLDLLGQMVSNTISAATGFAGSLLVGIFKGLPMPLKVVVVLFIVFVVTCIVQRIYVIIGGLSQIRKPKSRKKRNTEES